MSVTVNAGKRGKTWQYEFQWQGLTYRKRGFATKEHAEHAETACRRQLQEQGHEALYGQIGPKPVTWADALERYAEAKKGARTVSMILARLTWWSEWAKSKGAHYIQGVTAEIIDSGLEELKTTKGTGTRTRYKKGRSPQTQKHYKVQLRAFYKHAVNVWGCMTRNPVLQLTSKIHVPKFKPRILSKKERRELLLACESMMRQIATVGMFTGMRETAIMGLEAEDFQARPGWLRAWDRKPGQEPEPYDIPVAPELAKVIREIGVLKGPLWRKPDGSIQRCFPRSTWLRALRTAGLMKQEPIALPPRAAGTPGPAKRPYRLVPAVRFHDLRHMVGVALHEAGVKQAVIQAFMHHASREASDIYTRWISEQAMEDAAATLSDAHGQRE